MTGVPTVADRAVRFADFATLNEALNFAATGATGINVYSMRGEVAEAIPYSRLCNDARALAQRLLASGLAPGDPVGLIAETSGDFVRAFFACQYAGLIPAPLPLPAPLGGRDAYVAQILRMLDSAGAATLLGPEAITAWFKPAANLRFAGAVADLPAGGNADLPAVTADSPCYLQFSSGSTRFPAGVLVTHRALMANAVAIIRHGLQVKADDRAISWLPLYHDMGLVGFLLSPLACQMSVDLLPTDAFVRRPLLWLDLIGRNGATISYSPTFGYELCARRAEAGRAEGLDLSGWRIAGLGGDMIRTGPLHDFAQTFAACGFSPAAYVASYGMAEATLAITMAPLGDGLQVDTLDIGKLELEGIAVAGGPSDRTRGFVRCGPVLQGQELEVRTDTGAKAGERMVGLIFVRGDSLMQGYYGQPEETAKSLGADGWLNTGDLGYLDGGQIVLTGRSKDLMIINGRNLWPQDLEWTCEAEIESVRSGDVAAFSVPGDGEERVIVLVQTRKRDPEARAALEAEVGRILRQRHGAEAEVLLVGAHALPHTSSGKLSRSKARAAWLAGAFDPELTRA